MAIAAGGKTITFTKSGASVKSNGSTTTYSKSSKGFVRKSKSSNKLRVGITDAKTGRVIQEVSYGESKGSNINIGDKFKVVGLPSKADITITDSSTGKTTRTIVDTNTGKVLDRKLIAVRNRNIIQPNKASFEAPEERAIIDDVLLKSREKFYTKPNDSKTTKFFKGVGQTLVAPVLDFFGDKQSRQLINKGSIVSSALRKENLSVRDLNNAKKENITLSQVRDGISVMVQSSDPEVQGNLFGIIAFSALPGKNPFKNQFSLRFGKELKDINKQIDNIKGSGVTIRDRTRTGELLRTLEKEKAYILDEKKFIGKAVDKVKDIKKTKSQNVANSRLNQATTEVKKAKRIETKRQKLKKQRIKLKPETISRKLGETFKEATRKTTKQEPKIKVTLSYEQARIKQLEKAFKTSGELVSKLKKKIKKESGLIVIIRQLNNKRLEITFKQPKIRQKKQKTGIKSKERRYIIDEKGKVTRLDKKVGRKSTKKTKLSKKDLKKIEFKKSVIEAEFAKFMRGIDKQIESGQTKGISKQIINETKRLKDRYGKKAQVIIKPKLVKSIEKQNKKYKKSISTIRKELGDWKKVGIQLRKDLDRKTKDISKKQKQFQIRTNKLKSKTKNLSSQIKKELSLYKILFRFGVLSQIRIKELQQLQNLLDNLLENINKLDFKEIGGGSGRGKGTGGGRKPPKIPPKKPRTIKTTPPKPPIKPGKVRKPPIKPPVIVPKLKLNFDSKLPKGQNLKFNARYKTKGKIITLKLGLPINKAYRRVGQLIDRTTSRSMELYVAGTTKVKDIKKPNVISKFRIRKSKNKKVLILVEKSKHTIDTRGEKKGLTIAKALKKSTRKPKKSSKKPSKRLIRSKPKKKTNTRRKK